MLADAILVVHFAIVLFITAGLPVIYLGAAAGWTWVREWRWRALHFAAILVVATESILGLACPLTVWEDALRGHRAREGFIEHWRSHFILQSSRLGISRGLYLLRAAHRHHLGNRTAGQLQQATKVFSIGVRDSCVTN